MTTTVLMTANQLNSTLSNSTEPHQNETNSTIALVRLSEAMSGDGGGGDERKRVGHFHSIIIIVLCWPYKETPTINKLSLSLSVSCQLVVG